MKKTKIDVTNFTSFAAATSNFYAMLYGTPAAEIAHQIAIKVKNCTRILSDKPVDEEGVLCEESDEHPGKYELSTLKSAFVPEDFLRANNIDKFINESLDVLKTGIEQGLYPEGTVQRAMVEYMIHGLEGIQTRDLAITDAASILMKKYPGVGIEGKWANFAFTPKIVDSVEVNGQKQLQFPEDFPEDDFEGNTFFIPRADQEHAVYTKEELQESADRVNFVNYTQAGMDYKNSLIAIENLLTMDEVDPERKEALRNKILERLDQTEAQMRKAMEASADDPVTLRMFNNLKEQFTDTIKGGTRRSLEGNIEAFNIYRSYLRAGFPPEGIEEYNVLRGIATTLDNISPIIEKECTNTRSFIEKKNELKEAVYNLPPEGADENARKQWAENVADKIDKYYAEYEKIAGKLKFVEKKFPEVDQNMADKAELDRLNRKREQDIKDWENEKERLQKAYSKDGEYGKQIVRLKELCKKQVFEFGKYSLNARREALSNSIQDMIDVMSTMGTELTALKDKDPNISDNLKTEIDKVIAASDPKSKTTPNNYLKALKDLKTEADKAGNAALSEWADNSINYYGNHMKGAEKRGILNDEPLAAQRGAVHCPDGSKIDTALKKFDTQRSFIFGGWGKEHGKETEEHKELREAAEALQRGKQELNAIKDKSSEQWTQKATEVMQLTESVKTLSGTYVEKKGDSALSFAGRDRLKGAKDLANEAEYYRISLKKQIEANKKFDGIMNATYTYKPVAAAKEANKVNAANNGNAKKSDFNSVKKSFEDLKKEVDADMQQKKPAHERKSVSKNAEVKQADKGRVSVK